MRSGVILISLALFGCSNHFAHSPPASPLAVRYRMWNEGHSPSREGTGSNTSTQVYRGLLAKSMYSHCVMLPHDSEYFDRISSRCGGFRSVFVAAARLLLERSAHPDYLKPVRLGNRLLWIDWDQEYQCNE